MSSPISPKVALAAYIKKIPPVFFEAFNECIYEHWEGRSSYFAKDEIIVRLADAGLTPPQIAEIGLTNILEVYRAMDWLVEADNLNGVTHYHFQIPCPTTESIEKQLPEEKKSKWFAWLR